MPAFRFLPPEPCSSVQFAAFFMVLTLIPSISAKIHKYTETYGLLLEELNFKIRKTSTAPKQSNVLNFGAFLEGSASRLL